VTRSDPKATSVRPKASRPKLSALVIYKKSTYQLMVRERKNPRARALLRNNERSVERMLASHEDHEQTIREARAILAKLPIEASFRYRATADQTERFDLVITLGGDGTLLRASHLVGSQPVLAINTAPNDSVGFFCGGTKANLEEVLVRAVAGDLPGTELTRAQISLDGELVSRRVLNDVLYCHECPAATSRYILRHGDREEEHRSSGIWIGPAAGSTAAQRSAGGKVLPPSSRQIQYVVREPYMQNGARYALIKGLLEEKEQLRVISKIHGGRLYVDGPHLKLRVSLGSELVVKRSPESLCVLGFRQRG
jgi:NAD+ kinase